ncbi:MAG: alpha/beta hydrolase [Dehalococcoidia bacterium]|nr:alpha/beta hydrolase [Dehalococcoidia bacterium]
MSLFVTHGRNKLALHRLREGDGRALLLLHGLGDQAPEAVPAACAAWPGPVFGLDFTGHGQSSIPHGGGYTAEILMGDVDAGLALLGETTVVGYGLGGYIALLIGGGRPELVRGAVIADGRGLAGGGDEPGPIVVRGVPERHEPPDPFAMVELSDDLRPAEYAESFARLAVRGSSLKEPLAVAAAARPDWLKAVLGVSGVVERPVEDALAAFAEVNPEAPQSAQT